MKRNEKYYMLTLRSWKYLIVYIMYHQTIETVKSQRDILQRNLLEVS